MSRNTNIFFILVVLCGLSEGQKYLLGEPDTDDYFSDQDEFTNPTAPFDQSSLLSNGDYYIQRDLETSQIPVHLQETLPQYQQHIIPKQNFHLNRPAPFKPSKEYVKPSTHRPDYSHVLPHHFHREQLEPQIYNKKTANTQLEISSSDLEELNGNEFETEKPTKKFLTNFSLTNANSIINPLSDSNKENSNHVDTHFNKRDSREEEAKESLNENEYIDEPDEQISDSKNSLNTTVPESSDDKSNEKEHNELEVPEYDEEYEYDDEDDENEEAEPEIDEDEPTKNDTYDLLTMKPVNTSQDSMFNEFVDVESMDTTTQEPATSNILTQPPVLVPKNKGNDDMKDFPELVVSVVTSKTIENNTIIAPVSYSQLNTSTESAMPVENSTDSWIVIASVQTSRSISGTRYIPSSVIDQDERIQLLNENNAVPDPAVAEDKDKSSETYSTSSVVSSTSVKTKTSTESLIDKLDRVQSDLSSRLLTGGFKNDNIAVIEENLSTKVETTTDDMTTTPIAVKNVESKPYPQVNIRKFNAGNRPLRPKAKTTQSRRKGTIPTSTTKSILEQKDALSSILQKVKPVEDISALLPPGYKLPSSTEANAGDSAPITGNAKPVDDISAFLPPGYKPSTSTAKVDDIISKAKPVDDISALLPPGYKVPQSSPKTADNILSKAKPVDNISALLPPGYKPPQSGITEKTTKNIISKAKPVDDISSLLPPGYKSRQTTEKSTGAIYNKVKIVDDISALLPPGYKPSQSGTTEKTINNLLSKAKPVEDISALLPPGYKKGFSRPKVTTASSVPLESVGQNIPANLLPPGFKLNGNANENSTTSTAPSISSSSKPSSTSGGAVKLVFPSRPGGGPRKTPRLTTPRVQNEEVNKVTVPTIQKGWPVRASTEFSGWPTPSTTPISIEKLLEAARKAATSTTTEGPTEPPSTTTTTTTTTTTARPTTPGICTDDCDLAGTIKLVGGAKWVPELLDPNTKEYQILSNSVQSELETIYSNSPALKQWYKQIRIDGFSEGSILVDYLVEFNEIGHKVDTQEIKRLFHESLTDLTSNREGKSLNESKAERFSLGQFEVDPKYTDFIVIPKNAYPTVGYAEDVLLPQWAIAVIVIGLASLLFVIIFGVTVLFNRHKNSKKTPAPLTEDMLNELNKNHMGGLENYGVDDDFYNMEDVWSDKHYEQKPHKKRNNGSSVYDNSTANLYDSWRSQWNGQWNAYNTYYGHANSSQHSGHSGLRRPDHDTNF